MQDETSTSKVVQKELAVYGDNAARDVNKPSYVFPAPNVQSAAAFISQLVKKYKDEKNNNVEFRQTIEKLEHYSSPVSNEPILTLEQKLKNGGREDLINFALRTKEMFGKKLAKHSLSESAQEIHAFLLAEIVSRYHTSVYPHIYSGATIAAVNALIQTQIIEPLQEILGENALGHYADEINGMLYFLTGTCHIKWTK